MITVYEKPTCTKCRQLKKFLNDEGIEYELKHYYEERLSPEEIKAILKKLKMRPRDILRTGEEIYRRLGLKDKAITSEQLIRAMSNNPDLIQRPIIVKGNRAVLGRPLENIEELL